MAEMMDTPQAEIMNDSLANESIKKPVEWDVLSPEESDKQVNEALSQLGMPEEEIAQISSAIQEMRGIQLDDDQPGEETPQKEEKRFSTKDLAGIGLLMLIDLSINRGGGTTRLLEKMVLNKMGGALQKLGIDQSIIDSLLGHGDKFAKALFEMNSEDLRVFVQKMSKHQVRELVSSLTPAERKQLLDEGKVGFSKGKIDKNDLEIFILGQLSESEKKEYFPSLFEKKVETPAP